VPLIVHSNICLSNSVTTTLNKDFTSLDPTHEQFQQVTHILLDPSCSGSGLDRPDYGQPDSDLPTRLRNLATFQTRLLKHALSFPSVQRVVYSTCSIHAEENEKVVNTILNETTGWRVLRRAEQPRGLRNWPRRGVVEECASEEVAEGCIRCEKGTEGTIGFFAVGFVRDGEISTNGIETENYEDEEEEWGGIQ
jgi:putative methyltransferase